MKHIDEPEKMQKDILKKTYLLALIPLGSTLVMGQYSTLLGFVLGLVIATLIFRLRLLNIKRSLDLPEDKAVNFIRNRYFIEYIIYFVVLFTAARNPSVNFIGTAVGLFLVKLTVIIWVIIDLIREKLEEKKESFE